MDKKRDIFKMQPDSLSAGFLLTLFTTAKGRLSLARVSRSRRAANPTKRKLLCVNA